MTKEKHPIPSLKYDEALQYALHHHRPQFRKSTSIPYISHLMAVSALVWEHGGSEIQAIGALLHDVVEDHGGGTPENQQRMLVDVRERFGATVANIVEACTDSLHLGKEGRWDDRKRDYLKHLQTAEHDALLVSLADKTHNATAILMDLKAFESAGHPQRDFWARFNRGKTDEGIAQTLGYYAKLVAIFMQRSEQKPIGRNKLLENEMKRITDELVRLTEAGTGIKPDISWA